MSFYKPTVFTGIATALITPFKNGEIDYEAFGNLIDLQIDSGISALLVAGTTGESATLTKEEQKQMISYAKKRIRDRVPLLAGCGSNSTAYAVELAKNACEAGADALLAVTPYYNKASDQGILLHYRSIADAATRPIILYNVPSRTGYHLTMDHYRELSKHENIAGVKEASGDLGLVEALCAECSDRLDIYTGNDNQLLSSLKFGAKGCISVYSNIYPHKMIEIYRLFSIGDEKLAYQRMRSLLPHLQAMFWEINPIPVKYLASLLGICQAEYRLPLCPPAADTCRRLQSLLS